MNLPRRRSGWRRKRPPACGIGAQRVHVEDGGYPAGRKQHVSGWHHDGPSRAAARKCFERLDFAIPRKLRPSFRACAAAHSLRERQLSRNIPRARCNCARSPFRFSRRRGEVGLRELDQRKTRCLAGAGTMGGAVAAAAEFAVKVDDACSGPFQHEAGLPSRRTIQLRELICAERTGSRENGSAQAWPKWARSTAAGSLPSVTGSRRRPGTRRPRCRAARCVPPRPRSGRLGCGCRAGGSRGPAAR